MLDLRVPISSTAAGPESDGVTVGGVNQSALTAVVADVRLAGVVYAHRRDIAAGGGFAGGSDGLAAGSAPGGAGGTGVIIVRFPTQTRSYIGLLAFANDAAAATGGVLVGEYYRDSVSGAVRQRVA